MSAKTTGLSSSLEDYLETIHGIVQKKGAARPSDIASARNVAPSSVTTALKNLCALGLVNHEPYDIVTLTSRGRKIARKVSEKHGVLRDFFISVLGIDPGTADSCACGIEHVIPEEVLKRFIEYLDFVKKCGTSGSRWSEENGFVCRYCSTEKEETV